MVKGKVIFNKCSNNALGVTEAGAARVISETYQLLGKKGFKPGKEDVSIWMKLCDRNKDGVVDWEDYKYFVQRTFERSEGVRK